MTKIFISYRRDDAGGHARHLFENLAKRFGKRAVFMDVTTIQAGENFANRIDLEVRKCDVFLALIGKRWLNAGTDSGQRRLDEPEDYVREEIAAALKLEIKTIPVLLDDATMPQPDELPEGISDLTMRNAVELSSAGWDTDLQKIMELLPTAPRRWLWRTAMAATVLVILGIGAMYARRLIWPAPDPLPGIFNIAVMDFGQRESGESALQASTEGSGIAGRILLNLRTVFEGERSMSGVVYIARLKQHIEGSAPKEINSSLARVADATNATIVVHGVLDISDPPYRFTPVIHITQQFNGGEELTGENAFGAPIELTLPLDGSAIGQQNRLALEENLRPRLEALNLFTLGLAYLQVGKNDDRALELFEKAGEIDGWDSGKEVLHLFRGSALFKLNRKTEARAAYEEALETSRGEYGRALIGLGNWFFKIGRVDRAADLYRRAMQAKQNAPTAHVNAKAQFNLGLTLAFKARALEQSCDATEAQSVLVEVQAAHDRDKDTDLLRELAFKAHYQRGLLYRSCAENGDVTSKHTTTHLKMAIEQLEQALELGRPRPAYAKEWFEFDWFAPAPKLIERPWQKDRWVVWNVLGYCQLRLGELGQSGFFDQAIESLGHVTGQFERSRGDVTNTVGAEAYKLTARALQPTDPAAAQIALSKANEIAKMEAQ